MMDIDKTVYLSLKGRVLTAISTSHKVNRKKDL
ncbi:MAG: hypothetical protein BTN85_0751 [Candidatus Methanohalarchaeum thermophilum]|uniref:Uncharacterized protein n=1 Tax=Methanohalarchaeum thermophilum TaxID=1903181 RepID=A0A1Q6DV78_METT1|nr:MAG: hypothetical protein BTN85_0751 [Candidatus Methanohalarchaeum thermophilum]